MNLCSIASGSSGNCIYVGNQNTNLLIDAGISGKRIAGGLSQIDVNPEKIDALFVTHEHSDHVSGLGVMARRYHIPIYATNETIQSILSMPSLGKIPGELFHSVEPDHSFEINDIVVQPFSISHDAVNPVCYTFCSDGHKIGVATDLGKFDDYIIEHLEGSEALLLEANHDVNMLQAGSYPYYLKRRILSDRGHLSNDNSGHLICRLMGEKLKHIFLGHLSKENNYPELAYETVKVEMECFDKECRRQIRLNVARRDTPSEYITVS